MNIQDILTPGWWYVIQSGNRYPWLGKFSHIHDDAVWFMKLELMGDSSQSYNDTKLCMVSHLRSVRMASSEEIEEFYYSRQEITPVYEIF